MALVAAALTCTLLQPDIGSDPPMDEMTPAVDVSSLWMAPRGSATPEREPWPTWEADETGRKLGMEP